MQSPLMDRAMSASPLKPSYLLAILCGAAFMLAIVNLPVQPTAPASGLRIAPVSRERGQNGRTQSALWRSH